jgi:hypothetical protein
MSEKAISGAMTIPAAESMSTHAAAGDEAHALDLGAGGARLLQGARPHGPDPRPR